MTILPEELLLWYETDILQGPSKAHSYLAMKTVILWNAPSHDHGLHC